MPAFSIIICWNIFTLGDFIMSENVKKTYSSAKDPNDNHRYIVGKLVFVSPIRYASTGKWVFIKVQDIVSNDVILVQVWDNPYVNLVTNMEYGTIVQVTCYRRGYRKTSNSKVEYCYKASDIRPYVDTYSVYGTVSCVDAHIKRGKGKSAFSFMPEINGICSTMYGILDKNSPLWNNIKVGSRLQIVGQVDDTKINRPLMHVNYVIDKGSYGTVNK